MSRDPKKLPSLDLIALSERMMHAKLEATAKDGGDKSTLPSAETEKGGARLEPQRFNR